MGRLSWTGRRYLAGTEQPEDQAKRMKSRVQVQNDSSADQVQSTRAVIECEASANWIKALWQYSAMKKHPAGRNQLDAIYMNKMMSRKRQSQAHTTEDKRKRRERSVVRTNNDRTHNTSSGKTLVKPARTRNTSQCVRIHLRVSIHCISLTHRFTPYEN
ncbi:glutamate receptor 2.8-like [Dorcoceras hygrometricum]|uniref:Glutamate receptor 2.8-like n=1 Tax=Dorcoceras hygrometricum TaxID=472368 RepID=A0A2Z7CRR1_9LAMI|nr:glutamate receptor 2.8-like [Dorcoceras hygrometricum]